MSESSAPFGSNRATKFRDSPLNKLNPPPTKIRPSACGTISDTKSFAPTPGLNPKSSVPFAFSRAIEPIAVALITAKSPPTKIVPSACATSEYTGPFASAMNDRSTNPFVVTRTR